MDQVLLEQLTLAELKRAVEIMESKVGKPISKTTRVEVKHGNPTYDWQYDQKDPDITELLHTFKSIRRHTVALEKVIK